MPGENEYNYQTITAAPTDHYELTLEKLYKGNRGSFMCLWRYDELESSIKENSSYYWA